MIVIWAASIVTAAGVHTLDVWRYLIPAVPMVGLMLSLFVELAETIVADHAAPSATIRRAMPSGSSRAHRCRSDPLPRCPSWVPERTFLRRPVSAERTTQIGSASPTMLAPSEAKSDAVPRRRAIECLPCQIMVCHGDVSSRHVRRNSRQFARSPNMAGQETR